MNLHDCSLFNLFSIFLHMFAVIIVCQTFLVLLLANTRRGGNMVQVDNYNIVQPFDGINVQISTYVQMRMHVHNDNGMNFVMLHCLFLLVSSVKSEYYTIFRVLFTFLTFLREIIVRASQRVQRLPPHHWLMVHLFSWRIVRWVKYGQEGYVMHLIALYLFEDTRCVFSSRTGEGINDEWIISFHRRMKPIGGPFDLRRLVASLPLPNVVCWTVSTYVVFDAKTHRDLLRE